jgi:hypothetical protein
MADRRVQAPEIAGPEALRPKASGVDTYAGAPRPPQDDRLARLADALGGFNSNVQQFGRAYMVARQAGEKDEVERAAAFKQQYNSEEFNKAVDSGAIPRFASPKAQAAIDYTYGQNLAHQTGLEFQRKLSAGEIKLDDGSAQTWLQTQRDEIVQKNKWTAEGAGPGRGFMENMNQLWDRARDGAVKANIANEKERFDTAVFQQVEMFADKATSNKWDAATSWQELTKLKTQLQSAMHLTPKEADQKLMLALGRRMQVDPNWVVDMATTPRPDVKGDGILPPLSETPEYAAQIDQWKQAAVKFNTRTAKANAEATVAAADADALVRADGSFNRIEDGSYNNPFSGEKEELKASARREAAITAFTQASREKAVADKETPEQAFDREAAVFINNGIARPSWKKELDAIPGLANQTNLTNPAAVERLVRGAQTYDALEQRSPAYARDLVDDKARTFFQTYRVLKEYKTNPDGSNLTDVQALNAAAAAIRNDGPDTAAYIREQIVAANNEINSLRKSEEWFGTKAANTAQINTELRRLSTAFIRAGGLGAGEAIELAVKEMKKTGTVVNGHWLPKSGTMGLDLPKLSSTVIDNYVNSSAGKGQSASDVVLQPAPGGYFVLTDRSGIPVPGGGRFSHGDLVRMSQDIEAKRQQEIIQRQNATQRDNAAMDKKLDAAGTKLRETGGKVQDMINDQQGTPDEIIARVRSGKGINPDSFLGRSIIKQQLERKARQQAK